MSSILRWTLVAAALCAAAAPAAADEIVVKGDRIHGTVVNVTPKVVVFTTAYGKGNVEIPVEDVQWLSTESVYRVAHGDDATSTGRLVGLTDGILVVDDGTGARETVSVAEIQLVQAQADVEASPLADAKGRLRYWSGNLDLGLSVGQGTVDTTQFSVGLGAKRVKDPTRFLFKSGFLYGTQKKTGESRTQLADQLFGNLREEYDLTPRLYGYGNGYLEYNGIQRLSVRGVPEAGVGYKFWKSEEKDSTDFVAGTVGGSWVYEKYFGGSDRDYFAVAFGGEAQLTLPYGAKFNAGVSYLPSVSDFANDYLIKSTAALGVPVYKQLSFKVQFADDYDNTPAPGSSFNYLTTIFGLSAEL